MSNIFLITASSGDYSDYRERVIGYSSDLAEAQAYVNKCVKEMEDLEAKREKLWEGVRPTLIRDVTLQAKYDAQDALISRFDPDLKYYDFTSTTYHVEEVKELK